MAGKSTKSETKKQLLQETEEKLVAILASIDPLIDAKKGKKRAKRAAKILLRGIKPAGKETVEVKTGNEFSAAV